MSNTMTINIGGRLLKVTPEKYAEVLAKRRQLAASGRETVRSLRQAHLGPSGSYSKHAKATESGTAKQSREEVNNKQSWLTAKTDRMKSDFENFTVSKSRSLDRMNKAFNKLA